MIRQNAPILLIPAAWLMTFATTVYPGIDTYWIQHMHYFMLLFLAGFTVLSWKEMQKDPVLRTWRNVIALGVPFTLLGALSFITSSFTVSMAAASLIYWFAAPGAALIKSSRHMKDYSKSYRRLGIGSLTALLIFLAGSMLDAELLKGAAFVLAAITQTWSIVIAAEMDS